MSLVIDIARAAKMLHGNFMLSVNPSEQDSVASYLYDLGEGLLPYSSLKFAHNQPAFSSSHHPELLRKAAFHALHQFWTTSAPNSLTFSRILETICSLGANPEILSDQDWKLPQVSSLHLDEYQRQISLDRLLALVNCSSRSVATICNETN